MKVALRGFNNNFYWYSHIKKSINFQKFLRKFILGFETKPTEKSNKNRWFFLSEFDAEECQFW